MSRFIVVCRDDIDNKKYWRTGVSLKNKKFNSCALVKENRSEHFIGIQVNGEKSRDYFAVLYKVLQDIEATLLS